MSNINDCIALGDTTSSENQEALPEDDTKSHTCNFCSEKIDEINSYHCSTCVAQKADSTKSVFCEGCIWVLHIKKNHKVADWRGHEPVICEQHSMLCLMFCCDCSVVFCFKCLGAHCNHVFKPAHEKATELRKSVFEYLNEFDDRAKPLKNRVRVVNDILDERESFVKSLGQEKLTKTLSESFHRVVEANAEKWTKAVPETLKMNSRNISDNYIRTTCCDAICAVSNVADEMVLQLREILQMCDGRCIKTYHENIELFDAALNMQNVEFETHVSLRWDPSLDDYITHAVDHVLNQLREPTGFRRVFEAYKLSKLPTTKDKQFITLSEIFPEKNFKAAPGFTSCSEVFNITCTADKVHLSVLMSKADVRGKAFNDNWNAFNYCFDMNGVQSVFRSGCYLVFFKKEGFLSVFNLQSGKFTGCRKIKENIEPIKFEHAGSSVVWDSSKSQIELSKDDSEHEILPCSTRPSVYASFGNVHAFVNGDKKLTVYNIKTKLKIEVFPIHHGLSRIDNLSFPESEERLVLFDYTKKVSLTSLVILADFNSRSWSIEKLCKYEIPTEEPLTHFCAIANKVFAITSTSMFA